DQLGHQDAEANARQAEDSNFRQERQQAAEQRAYPGHAPDPERQVPQVNRVGMRPDEAQSTKGVPRHRLNRLSECQREEENSGEAKVEQAITEGMHEEMLHRQQTAWQNQEQACKQRDEPVPVKDLQLRRLEIVEVREEGSKKKRIDAQMREKVMGYSAIV